MSGINTWTGTLTFNKTYTATASGTTNYFNAFYNSGLPSTINIGNIIHTQDLSYIDYGSSTGSIVYFIVLCKTRIYDSSAGYIDYGVQMRRLSFNHLHDTSQGNVSPAPNNSVSCKIWYT